MLRGAYEIATASKRLEAVVTAKGFDFITLVNSAEFEHRSDGMLAEFGAIPFPECTRGKPTRSGVVAINRYRGEDVVVVKVGGDKFKVFRVSDLS